MTTYYRPGLKTPWFPKTPLPTGGNKIWTGELILEHHTGRYYRKPDKERWKVYTKECRANGVDPYKAWTGMRNSANIKSSAKMKVHRGGPFDGAKLKRFLAHGSTPVVMLKGKARRSGRAIPKFVPMLPDVYVVPPWHGCYQWSEDEDAYVWQQGR